MMILYYALLLLNNAIACIFFGMAFLNPPVANNEESLHPLREQHLVFRLILYGFVISLVFSLVSLLVGNIFKIKMSFERKDLRKLFVYNFLSLLFIWLGICLFMYIK